MCRYIVERDWCRICRRWRAGQRWRKVSSPRYIILPNAHSQTQFADCNHERCRHSDAHPSRVHHFRRSLLGTMSARSHSFRMLMLLCVGSLMRNHPHFVVHLAIKAISAMERSSCRRLRSLRHRHQIQHNII
jgi:hypothetical protein